MVALTSPPSLRQKIESIVRWVLGIAFSVMAAGYFRSGYDVLVRVDLIHPHPVILGHALTSFVIGLYTTSIAYVYFIRFRPVSGFPGFFPSFAALLGGYLMAAFLFLTPREDLPLWVQLLSCSFAIVGNGLAIVVLTHLGRSFSILPESRKLVTHGAYAVVRHPLYLAEALASLGVTLIFLSPAAILILVTQLSWQLVRMHYEEKTLRESFPEYEAYARQTKRIIPGIY